MWLANDIQISYDSVINNTVFDHDMQLAYSVR